ncbi:hypothetical protein AMJ50_00790 [Parcubacteria bacterium DG_74_3]|nr:MAG: hypothetical protein AMJ50_00790 [Parcubacteria bacterium DG_74_3]
MNFLEQIFNEILYQPLLNALVLLYGFLPGHDFGIAIIVLTILIRIALSPLMVQSIKSQKNLSNIQTKSQEIQLKHKNNKEKQAQELMELYQREKINPLGGCLPVLIQLPVLIALYRVFWKGLQPEALNLLYNFVLRPEAINPYFLGVLDLSQPNLVLAVLAGISQYFQAKMMVPKKEKSKSKEPLDQFSKQLTQQTLYFFPAFTFFILLKLPAAVGLYWLVTILFTMIQQYFIYPSYSKT